MASLEKKNNVLVLFDFDGTLANTNPLIIKSFNEVFKRNFPSIEINKKMELSYIGPTLHYTFSKYLKLDNVDMYVNEYRDINMRMQIESLKEINNATSLLKSLKDCGYTLGVVSSKMKDSLMLGIKILDIEKYFDVIVGSDEINYPKPNPEGLHFALEKLECDFAYKYYVGDTKTDVLASKAANFKAISIITTDHFLESIKESKPNHIIYDLLEIEEIIKEDLNGKL